MLGRNTRALGIRHVELFSVAMVKKREKFEEKREKLCPGRHRKKTIRSRKAPAGVEKYKNRAGPACAYHSTGRTGFRLVFFNEVSRDIRGFVHNGRFSAVFFFGQIFCCVSSDHP